MAAVLGRKARNCVPMNDLNGLLAAAQMEEDRITKKEPRSDAYDHDMPPPAVRTPALPHAAAAAVRTSSGESAGTGPKAASRGVRFTLSEWVITESWQSASSRIRLFL